MFSNLKITISFFIIVLVSALNLYAVNYHAVVVGLAYNEAGGSYTTECCYYDANSFYKVLVDSLGWTLTMLPFCLILMAQTQ